MRDSCVIKHLIYVVICMIAICCNEFAEAKPQGDEIGREYSASDTLRHYIQLRLSNANWKDYSKYITWPDEPGWDCNWVVGHYAVGTVKKQEDGLTIPVQYERLGLFCYDFDFKAKVAAVTVDYKLVRDANNWKVNGPIPDYPDIGANTVIALMKASANDLRESPERREQFSATAQRIAETLSTMKMK